MNTRLLLLTLIGVTSLPPAPAIRAASTIDPANPYAWGANIGWIDWRVDAVHGAVIGEYVCSGYLYAPNLGWVNLGNGSPPNHIQYRNNSATDFGVNHDGAGNLRGYAYGPNIGWVTFEALGAPRLDLKTGRFSGYAYSANCGWISLSNATAHVRTDSILPGVDTDGDGIADAWELIQANSLAPFTASSDTDGDAASDVDEYRAGTNPRDAGDHLRITAYAFAPGGTSATLSWTSASNRCYEVQSTLSLAGTPTWTDSGLGLIRPAAGATTSRNLPPPLTLDRFYRVRALRPLFPGNP